MSIGICQHALTARINIAIADTKGNALTPNSIQVKILDEQSVELQAAQYIAFAPGDTSFDLIVSGAINTISDPLVNTQARVIVVNYGFASSVSILVRHIYLVRRDVVLSFMKNTYISHEAAEVLAASIARLDNWVAASDVEKIMALETAYERIGRLSFEVSNPSVETPLNSIGVKDILSTPTISISGINQLTPEEMSALPARFLMALRRAQVVEANAILETGETITNKRRGGLMSETVGESSQMWRPGKPILFSVSRETLEELSGYVKYGAGIKRA